jgi:hypothetical protein
MAIGKGRDQGGLVDDRPAGNIHHDGTGGQETQSAIIQEAAGLRRQRSAEHDDICLGK